MSSRIPPPGDNPLALRPISQALTGQAAAAAAISPRRRALLRYHELDEPIQRMINAVEPASYIGPHAHDAPPKVEVFLVLRGCGLAVRFDPAGAILEAVELRPGGPVPGIEMPPGAWHIALALESGTVFYEIKQGPYDAATDKTFAAWAYPRCPLWPRTRTISADPFSPRRREGREARCVGCAAPL